MDQRRLVLVATILGSSMAFLDATVVNVALPTIERDFDLGLAGEQWIFVGYSVALAALYLPSGALGDRYGYVNTFTVGVAGFAVASLMAGAAPSGEVLIAARVIQGVFGALLTPGSLALLRAAYGDDAGRAIGSWTAWTGIATVAGPPAGGALVEVASWRWVFLLNLPVAAAAIVATHASRDKCHTTRRPRRLDVAGLILGAVAVGALVWALLEGPRHGFGSGSALAGFAISGAALAAFLAVEARISEPMLPLSLFRVREFSIANLATLFVYGALGGFLFLLALFAQSVLGYSPLEAGLLFIPTTVVMLLFASRFGRLADRVGPRPFLVVGPGLIGFALVLMTRVDVDSSVWRDILPPLLILSLGLAITVPPITATALKAAPAQRTGIASGVNTTLSRLGQLLAVALLGLVATIVFGSTDGSPFELGTHSTGELSRAADAFQAAMWAAAGLAFAGALVSGIGLPRRERARTGAIEPAPDTVPLPPPASHRAP